MTETTSKDASYSSGGGIAWEGSLVGSQNPENLGYRYSSVHKRYKRNTDDEEAESKLPSNIVVQFQDPEGTQVANRLDLPCAFGRHHGAYLVVSANLLENG